MLLWSSDQLLIAKYDETCDPCDLDLLIYKLEQLYRILLATNVPLSVLENLGWCFHLLSTLQDETILAEPFLDAVSSGPGNQSTVFHVNN